jgi:hypothetical protein
VTTRFDPAVELDDPHEETRGTCLRYERARSAAGLADESPFRQRIKTSENLVLTEPRPIGPLIPFRAGPANSVLAKGVALPAGLPLVTVAAETIDPDGELRWQVINLQKNRYSTAAEIPFTVSVAIALDRLRECAHDWADGKRPRKSRGQFRSRRDFGERRGHVRPAGEYTPADQPVSSR